MTRQLLFQIESNYLGHKTAQELTHYPLFAPLQTSQKETKKRQPAAVASFGLVGIRVYLITGFSRPPQKKIYEPIKSCGFPFGSCQTGLTTPKRGAKHLLPAWASWLVSTRPHPNPGPAIRPSQLKPAASNSPTRRDPRKRKRARRRPVGLKKIGFHGKWGIQSI